MDSGVGIVLSGVVLVMLLDMFFDHTKSMLIGGWVTFILALGFFVKGIF